MDNMFTISPYTKTDINELHNEIMKSSDRFYSQRVGKLTMEGVYILSPNRSLISREEGNGGDGFTNLECLAKNILIESGILSKTDNIRHGVTIKNECDILVNDEEQIEVVLAISDGNDLNERILNCFTFEKVIAPSEALIKKFDQKNYTPNFRKSICIISACNADNLISLTLGIRNNLYNHIGKPSKNSFTSAYLVRYDIRKNVYELTAVVDGIHKGLYEIVSDSKDMTPLISKKLVSLNDLLDDGFYYLDVTENGKKLLPTLVVRGAKVLDTINKYNIDITKIT